MTDDLQCFVCEGAGNHVSEMTDGRTHYPVCDTCREMVTLLFHVHGSLEVAVMESAQAVRGNENKC